MTLDMGRSGFKKAKVVPTILSHGLDDLRRIFIYAHQPFDTLEGSLL